MLMYRDIFDQWYENMMAIVKLLYRVARNMMTSSNGNIFRVTGHLRGEFTGLRWIPAQRPVTRGLDVFFDLRLDGRLSKQLWGWWFETPSRPFWRHSNACDYLSSTMGE